MKHVNISQDREKVYLLRTNFRGLQSSEFERRGEIGKRHEKCNEISSFLPSSGKFLKPLFSSFFGTCEFTTISGF